MTNWIHTFISRFTVLKGAPRELWVIYIAKILEIVSYGMVTSTVVLWLSSDLGYSDAGAGDWVAIWSTLITLVTLLVGSLVDAIGVRKSFLLGFLVCLVTRFIVAGTTIQWIAIPFGLMVMAVGEALMVPVMTAGLRQYTTVAQRSMAFSMFYVLMNVGFAIAGWSFDALRTSLGEYGTWTVPGLGTDLSTYRTILLVAALVTIPGLLFTWAFLREGVEMTEDGIRITPTASRAGQGGLAAALQTVRTTGSQTIRIFVEVWKQPTFHRFLVFLTFIAFVKLVFYHMHFTFPKYGIRELGEGARVGTLWGVLNPVIIVFFTPLVGALSQRVTSYRMIAVGTTISALPVLLLALPRAVFQPLADGFLGHLIGHTWLGLEGPVDPLYVSITLFVAIFSVGEAIWSPRLYEYTASIAPKDQVGSYMALSLLPYFLGKLGVGILSGRMLEAWCPAEGPRQSETLWLVIGLMALVGPIGIIALKKYIRSHEEGRDAPQAA